MSTPRFVLKEVKDNISQIYLFYTYRKGERLRYFTGVTIPKDFWNEDAQRVKASRNFPQHIEINGFLNSLANEAVKIAFANGGGDLPLQSEQFKKALDIFRGRTEEKGRVTFLQFFEQFIREREGNKEYAKGSIVVYKTTLKKIQAFAKDTRRKVDFPDFDYSLFADLTNYLFSQDFGTNYVHKITSTLKTVLLEADRRELSPELNYKSDWLQVKKKEVPAIYLNEEELCILFQLDLSQYQRLDRIRDLFLIGCHTGLRFSDFTSIKPENLKTVNGRQVINIVTQKTGQMVTIPLKEVVRSILAKYNGSLPGSISNQKMNEYLKELGQLAGIEETVLMTRFKGRRREDTVYKKFELITTHTARRSFASNAFKANVPVKSIMQITGHKTEKEFYKYIKLNSEEHAVIMAENPFFK